MKFMEQPYIVSEEGWFGFEQEYWITDLDGLPLGWQLNPEFVHDSKFVFVDLIFTVKGKCSLSYHQKSCELPPLWCSFTPT